MSARSLHVSVSSEYFEAKSSNFFGAKKVCTKCGVAKPRCVEQFSSDARKSDGLRSDCRKCQSEVRKKWYRDNRDHALAVAETYRKNNPDFRKWVPKPYAIEDRQAVIDRDRATEKSNPARVAMERMRERLRRLAGNSGHRTIGFLGCTSSELRVHLERQFLPGMSWDNRSEWHIDHIVPLASFDLSDPVQRNRASHYTNLQPLWAADNIRKGASLPTPTTRPTIFLEP